MFFYVDKPNKCIGESWKVIVLPKRVVDLYPHKSKEIESNIKKTDKIIKGMIDFVNRFIQWSNENNIPYRCTQG